MAPSNATIVPHIYLDSPIVIDVLRSRRTASLRLLEIARQKDWRLSTSQFTIMEVLDVEQDDRFFILEVTKGRTVASVLRDRYKRKLSEAERKIILKKVQDFLELRYPLIKYFHLTGEGFDRASGLCANTNISAPDCLHLATALEAGCDVLVTTDEHFLKEAKDYISICTPEQINEVLVDLNFSIT